MNQAQSEALRKIVDHNWTDEERNFKEAGEPQGHIYEAFNVLQRYLSTVEHPYGQAGPIGIVRDHPSHDESLSTEHLIIWSLLPLAKLPNSVANLVKDAVHSDGHEQRLAALAAIDAIARQGRNLDAEIPF